MSATFTKLFSSITDSSIWSEDHETVRVWVTMLAMSDKHGHVIASLPGLANRARVSLEATERALKKFLEPDPHSQSREMEGRRVRVIDRGWALINHAKFRKMRSTEERRAQNRAAAKKYRERKAGKSPSSQRHHSSAKSATVSHGHPESAHAEAYSEAYSEASPEKQIKEESTRVRTRAPNVALDALKAALKAQIPMAPALSRGNAEKAAGRLKEAVSSGLAPDLASAASALVRAAVASGKDFPWCLLDANPYAGPRAARQDTGERLAELRTRLDQLSGDYAYLSVQNPAKAAGLPAKMDAVRAEMRQLKGVQ